MAVLLLALVGALIGTARLMRSRKSEGGASLSGHDGLGSRQLDRRPSMSASVAVAKLLVLSALGVVAVLVVVMLWPTFAVDWPED